MKRTYLLTGLVLAGFLMPNSVQADDHEGFDTHKSNILKRIDERAAKLAEHKACVSASTNQEGIKACLDKMRDWMKEHREERMERKRERREKRKD